MTDKSGTVQIGFDLDGLPSPHKALLVAAAASDGACGEKDASKVEAHATTGGGARVQAAVGGAAGIQGLTKELFPRARAALVPSTAASPGRRTPSACAGRWSASSWSQGFPITAKWYCRVPSLVVTFFVSTLMKSCVSQTHGQQQ